MNFECYFNETLRIIKYLSHNTLKIVLKLLLSDFLILKRKWVSLINNELKTIKLAFNDVFLKDMVISENFVVLDFLMCKRSNFKLHTCISP